MNYAIIKGMEIQPEDRPQTVQELLTLLQLKPQSIMSQMSQVSRTILSQMATLHIPGIKPLYQNSVKNFYRGQANGLFIGTGIFIFVFVIYIYSPKLNFSIISRPSSPQLNSYSTTKISSHYTTSKTTPTFT